MLKGVVRAAEIPGVSQQLLRNVSGSLMYVTSSGFGGLYL